jgi:hypothetical protein
MRFLSLMLALTLVCLPVTGNAQQQRNGLSLGIGIGRFVPLQPLASDEGNPVDYKLADAGLTVVAIDYWLTRSFATRLSYQWLTTDLVEPDQPSFARIRSGYLGVVVAPVQIGNRARPYAVLGGGFRYYDVNSFVGGSDVIWDIAPKQTRLAGYGAVGSTLRIGRAALVPEAGIFINPFEHYYQCFNCAKRDTQLDLLLSLKFQI